MIAVHPIVCYNYSVDISFSQVDINLLYFYPLVYGLGFSDCLCDKADSLASQFWISPDSDKTSDVLTKEAISCRSCDLTVLTC